MSEQLKNSVFVDRAFKEAVMIHERYRHEFMMVEHLLLALCRQDKFKMAYAMCGGDSDELTAALEQFLEEQERVPDDVELSFSTSKQLTFVLNCAYDTVRFSSAPSMDVPHLVAGILRLDDSNAAYFLRRGMMGNDTDLLNAMVSEYGVQQTLSSGSNDEGEGGDGEEDDIFGSFDDEEQTDDSQPWRQLVVRLNDTIAQHNPLIGREAELERTIQVLCRKEKNNPLHVGESGVGKTALVYGLAARIEAGEVPDRLKGSSIYQIDLGTLLAGTQFRGDFEKRLKMVMEGISQEEAPVVYIDEIHSLVGAGQTGEGSMDASNMLKPYLEAGKIRFIGSTTYDEYKRYFSRSKGMVRRFQQIDIDEPSVEETVKIIEGLKAGYEAFHHVTYDEGVIPFAVEASAKHINDRFLPDKAIDLIDEAGAYREIHPLEEGPQTVDRQLISDILAKICKVDAMAMKEDDTAVLETLRERITAQIYGQDEAVTQVVEAVQMSKAGLLDDNKPLASLLFVGPTGVGKTEVARVLAREMGVELVRFDMSEYTEKHTVAKLIGSPAGYVGYEDGGLLTDAIRKTPNCVLLLDEIEKAHQDIYNILLQVMDYAKLTDNKGQKADFRNVVLIMTSNAGAQYASQASIGFGGNVSRGEAMLRQVKKTFKPEFLNRLSGQVVFHDMDRTMATMILDKKLRELQAKLTVKNVVMTLTPEAHEYLLNEGFTREYGAREMDRVIAQRLKPLLMREILFGSLKNGGKVSVNLRPLSDSPRGESVVALQLSSSPLEGNGEGTISTSGD